jgi:hypothetical protein
MLHSICILLSGSNSTLITLAFKVRAAPTYKRIFSPYPIKCGALNRNGMKYNVMQHTDFAQKMEWKTWDIEERTINWNVLYTVSKNPEVPCMRWGCGHQNNIHPLTPQMEEEEGNLESLQSKGMCFPHSFQTTLDGCKPNISKKQHLLWVIMVGKNKSHN